MEETEACGLTPVSDESFVTGKFSDSCVVQNPAQNSFRPKINMSPEPGRQFIKNKKLSTGCWAFVGCWVPLKNTAAVSGSALLGPHLPSNFLYFSNETHTIL